MQVGVHGVRCGWEAPRASARRWAAGGRWLLMHTQSNATASHCRLILLAVEPTARWRMRFRIGALAVASVFVSLSSCRIHWRRRGHRRVLAEGVGRVCREWGWGRLPSPRRCVCVCGCMYVCAVATATGCVCLSSCIRLCSQHSRARTAEHTQHSSWGLSTRSTCSEPRCWGGECPQRCGASLPQQTRASSPCRGAPGRVPLAQNHRTGLADDSSAGAPASQPSQPASASPPVCGRGAACSAAVCPAR